MPTTKKPSAPHAPDLLRRPVPPPRAEVARIFRHLPAAPDPCQRHLLSHGELGRVELCTGGTVSLVLGPHTLRLPFDALLPLHELLYTALRSLEHADQLAALHALRGNDN